MLLGYFAMPSHPPERGLKEGHDWDLQTLRWLDELGYDEAWIGEHYTAPWEPHPSPDLLIAQALLQTKKLRIGPAQGGPTLAIVAGKLAADLLFDVPVIFMYEHKRGWHRASLRR